RARSPRCASPRKRRAFPFRPAHRIEPIANRSGPTDPVARAVRTALAVARFVPVLQAELVGHRRSVAPTALPAAGPTDSAARTAAGLAAGSAGLIVRTAAAPAAGPVPRRAAGARSARA